MAAISNARVDAALVVRAELGDCSTLCWVKQCTAPLKSTNCQSALAACHFLLEAEMCASVTPISSAPLSTSTEAPMLPRRANMSPVAVQAHHHPATSARCAPAPIPLNRRSETDAPILAVSRRRAPACAFSTLTASLTRARN